jgi:hypothetical protein
MTTVHDGVASVRTGIARPAVAVPPRTDGRPTPCVAHPNSRLVHLDGRCECFFGGPPPVFGGDSAAGGALP